MPRTISRTAPRVCMTIGGSDCGGGAGIQADIKTFSALGLHGTSAITAITAQNTLGVKQVFGLGPEAISSQIRAILDDFQVSCAKTGMLHSAEAVSCVAEILIEAKIPLVIDPVIEAEAGGRLLKPDAVEVLKSDLIPIAKAVTPNIFEARALTGIEVKDLDSAREAAQKIQGLGAEAVIGKGGHLDCTDLVLDCEGKVHLIKGIRVQGGNHGVGCSYSAALTSSLAEGCSLVEAAHMAQAFAARAVLNSFEVGHGPGPVNQAGSLREETAKYRARFRPE